MSRGNKEKKYFQMVRLSKLGGIFLQIKWKIYARQARRDTYEIRVTSVCLAVIHSLTDGLALLPRVSHVHVTCGKATSLSLS